VRSNFFLNFAERLLRIGCKLLFQATKLLEDQAPTHVYSQAQLEILEKKNPPFTAIELSAKRQEMKGCAAKLKTMPKNSAARVFFNEFLLRLKISLSIQQEILK